MAGTFGTNEAGEIVKPCPMAEKPIQHWIEILVLGEDDLPVSYQEVRITLPDGTVVKSYSDQNGLARVDGIETAGNCQFTFPQLDKDAWGKKG